MAGSFNMGYIVVMRYWASDAEELAANAKGERFDPEKHGKLSLATRRIFETKEDAQHYAKSIWHKWKPTIAKLENQNELD
jgi:hypothetical protein